VYHAETTEQVKPSTCPSKPEARGSDPQVFYYQCDEKLFTVTRDSPAIVEWVKRRDVVGEIPLVLVALTRVNEQRAGDGRFGAMVDGHLARQNPGYRIILSFDQIFLDFGYRAIYADILILFLGTTHCP
jgi:hypothetical protein